MAQQFSKHPLSGTPGNGRVIPVAATGTPGTVVHTALAGTAGLDQLFLWASNVTNADATLTLEWGGTGDPGDHLVHAYTIPANSAPVRLVEGLPLNNGLVAAAFSDTAGALNVSGYVNRIS